MVKMGSSAKKVFLTTKRRIARSKSSSKSNPKPFFPKLKDFLKSGLDLDQVKALRRRFGSNQLAEKPPPSDLQFFLVQFKNPLVAVLVVAGLMTVGLGDYTDTLVIGLAVVVNTVLGFVQERKAFKSLAALKRVLNPEAWVTREGKRQKIDARNLVPGDVVWLYQGDKVPADGLVVESSDLMVDEAILTGESVPVGKSVFSSPLSSFGSVSEIEEFLVNLSSRQQVKAENLVAMGTVVVGGSGGILVTKVGMATEMGKIAFGVGEYIEAPTPLERRLGQLAKWLTMGVVALALLIFFFGLASGRSFTEMFTISVALAVAAIPEGLIVALTVILAIGMQRILKRRAVVRKLVAAETLGGVTTVCVDKTGTLTEGKLRVVRAEFGRPQLGLRASVLANDLRDATELARWEWARNQVRELARGKDDILGPQRLVDKYPRDEALPFAVERRFLATRHGREIFVVGAPELVLSWTGASARRLDRERRRIESWGERGWRMIGFGYFKAETAGQAQRVFSHLRRGRFGLIELRWLGLMAFADPVRFGVKRALLQAQKAGIDVKVITGDYRGTAEAVMRELGISVRKDQVLEGFELEKLTDEQLAACIAGIKLFARTKPTQKLRIVKSLKAQGEVVGMMGDGVNDAPALAAADIGMVVGGASEVARETADLVLLDSNFATILAAIEEGRGIFDNLRKIVLYLLSDTFSEVITVVGSLLLGWPLAISAAQILWINLIDDGLPNLALTIDPKASNLLRRKPLDPQVPLIDAEVAVLIGMISLVTGLSSLLAFSWFWPHLGEQAARSVVFAVLGLDSLFYVFSCRTLKKGVWQESLWKNPWLVVASVVGVLLTLVAMYVPVFQRLLGLIPLGFFPWLVIIAISLGVVAIIEGVKFAWLRFED